MDVRKERDYEGFPPMPAPLGRIHGDIWNELRVVVGQIYLSVVKVELATDRLVYQAKMKGKNQYAL